MYPYGTKKLPSMEDGYLYHFTSADILMKILESMSLKTSTFKNLNDLNESDLNCSWGGTTNVPNHNKAGNFIKEHCRLICFTQNYYLSNHKEEAFCQAGYKQPRMWAQYADNNGGVCIAIKEKEFIEKNKELLCKTFYKTENIFYKINLFDEKIVPGENPEDFVKKHYQHIFFTKYIDWEGEHERRLFGIDLPEYLSIEGCIEFIVLGKCFSQDHLNRLTHFLINQNLKTSFVLMPHDFAKQANCNGFTCADDYAGNIFEEVKKKQLEARNYLEFPE